MKSRLVKPFEDNKILIIGAKGNLGSQFFNILGNDYRLLAWDKEEIDITDRHQVEKMIGGVKPNIIINTAAYNAVDKCEKDKKEYEQARNINGEAVGYLADAAIANNSVLVHFSSDYVFAGDKKKGYEESSLPSPINKYGFTKLLGEKELIKRQKNRLKYYLVRTSKLFGAKGLSHLAKPSFFDIMLDLAQKKDELSVVDDEVSCFTYTPDLAQAVKELFESKRPFGVYHIVNEGSATWYQAALELFKQSRIKKKVKPITAEEFPRAAARPKYSVLKNTKLKHLRRWQKALKEYIASQNIGK